DEVLHGAVDQFSRAGNDNITEVGRSHFMGPHPDATSVWVVSGWADDAATPARDRPPVNAAYPRVSFVVMQGNHAVPCKTQLFTDRTEPAYKFHAATTGTGFQLLIPVRMT